MNLAATAPGEVFTMTARPKQETFALDDSIVLICEIGNLTRTDIPLTFCLLNGFVTQQGSVASGGYGGRSTTPREFLLEGEEAWGKSDAEGRDPIFAQAQVTIPRRRTLEVILDAQKAVDAGRYEWVVVGYPGKCIGSGFVPTSIPYLASNPISFTVAATEVGPESSTASAD